MVGISLATSQCCPGPFNKHCAGLKVLAVLAGVGVLLLAAGAGVVCDASEREVLRGIKSIGIEVENLPRMAEKLGIKKDSLKMEVVAKLRQAGITVAGDEEFKRNPSIPFLKVRLLISYSKPTYVFAVVVGLNEKVRLERDPEIISYAMPWWRIIKGEHIGEGDVARDVLETLRHIMNEFVANYEAANREALNLEERAVEPQGLPQEKVNVQEDRTMP